MNQKSTRKFLEAILAGTCVIIACRCTSSGASTSQQQEAPLSAEELKVVLLAEGVAATNGVSTKGLPRRRCARDGEGWTVTFLEAKEEMGKHTGGGLTVRLKEDGTLISMERHQ